MSNEVQITDKKAWQVNRRRLAYIAMGTMVATIIASFVWPERAKEIPAMDVLFGADALVSFKKK